MTERAIRKLRYKSNGGMAGAGVDYRGNAVLDPTANVIALSEAATQRQDDLRALNDEKLASEIRRIDAEAAHIAEIARLRAEFQEKLSLAESKRIDAIRTVDVGAVAIASERAAQQASVLATQVSQSAETLRTLVATTATSFAAQQNQLQSAVMERISALEKSSYVGVGKQAVSDPMMVELLAEVKSLRESRSTGSGKSQGISASWAIIVGVGSFMLTLLSIGLIGFHMIRG